MSSPSIRSAGPFLSSLPGSDTSPVSDAVVTLVEGLPMRSPFDHQPVMATEVVALLASVPQGVIVDGTAGGGGHAELLLDGNDYQSLLALDKDGDAIVAASARLARFGERAKVLRASFADLASVLRSQGIGKISGLLLDLGVSSHQFDEAERGFSYRSEARLDMRMDTRQQLSAYEIVNTTSDDELFRVLIEGGEDRFPRRIVKAILSKRPITTTAELAEVVASAIPAAARRSGGHPAKRTFQAVRLAVNSELEALTCVLEDAVTFLAPGGRIVVLSYHSGEDRIVKKFFRREETGGCVCPVNLPCVCGAIARLRPIRRSAVKASQAEIAKNPRASSARLRAAQRISEDHLPDGQGRLRNRENSE